MYSHQPHHRHDENCGCHGDHHHAAPAHQPERHQHNPQAITVKTHDASLVGSYRLTIELSFEEAVTTLDAALKKIAAQITERGGIIGHIKANLTAEGQSCMISLTEEKSDQHYNDSRRCQVEGVAIVFGILPEQLTAILNTVLGPYRLA